MRKLWAVPILACIVYIWLSYATVLIIILGQLMQGTYNNY